MFVACVLFGLCYLFSDLLMFVAFVLGRLYLVNLVHSQVRPLSVSRVEV